MRMYSIKLLDLRISSVKRYFRSKSFISSKLNHSEQHLLHITSTHCLRKRSLYSALALLLLLTHHRDVTELITRRPEMTNSDLRVNLVWTIFLRISQKRRTCLLDTGRLSKVRCKGLVRAFCDPEKKYLSSMRNAKVMTTSLFKFESPPRLPCEEN